MARKTPKTALVDATPLHEMAPRDRARSIMKLDDTKAELQALAKESTTIKTADGKDNYDAVHAARMKLKNTRIRIEKVGKDARDDATKFGKEVIAVEKELTAIIEPEEKRLKALQDAADQAEADAKAAALKREQERREAISKRIFAMATAAADVVGETSAGIQAKLDWLRDQDDETFEGADLESAQLAKRNSLRQLESMLVAAKNAEAQQAEMERQAEALRAAQAELASARETQQAFEAQVREKYGVEPDAKLVGDAPMEPISYEDKALPHTVLGTEPRTEPVAQPAPPPVALQPVVRTMARIHAPEPLGAVSVEAELKMAISDALMLLDQEDDQTAAKLRGAANRYFSTEEF